MVNLGKHQLSAISEFYNEFNETIETVVSEILETKHVEVSQEFLSSLPDNFETFKDTHQVVCLKGLGGYFGYILLAISENDVDTFNKLLTTSSEEEEEEEIIKNKNNFKSCSSTLEKVIKEIKTFFQKKHVKILSFENEPKLLDKESLGFDEAFMVSDFDIASVYKIKINEQSFEVFVIFNSSELIGSMKELHIIEDSGAPIDIAQPQTNTPSPKMHKAGHYDIKNIADVKIDICAELGRAQVSIKQILSLIKGSILELDTLEGQDLPVFANGSEVAKAQVVVVDGNFGIKITKILDPQERVKHI